MFLLEALHHVAVKLERQTMLSVTIEIISEVAELMWDVDYARIRVDWLDKLIKEIMSSAMNLYTKSTL